MQTGRHNDGGCIDPVEQCAVVGSPFAATGLSDLLTLFCLWIGDSHEVDAGNLVQDSGVMTAKGTYSNNTKSHFRLLTSQMTEVGSKGDSNLVRRTTRHPFSQPAAPFALLRVHVPFGLCSSDRRNRAEPAVHAAARPTVLTGSVHALLPEADVHEPAA